MARYADVLEEVSISEDLIRRFDKSGPRYTSYPTADRFHDGFHADSYVSALKKRQQQINPPPYSLYVHIPFCESLCYFCACNKIITKDKQRSSSYVDTLLQELALLAPHLGVARDVVQVHFGGGTPTFLAPQDLTRLMQALKQHFHFLPDAEISIEIDPRTVTNEMMPFLAQLGFNRTSFGVQDFDLQVQQAINRIQPKEKVEQAMQASRSADFGSINTDLIYGLPNQSLHQFEQTVDSIVQLRPDRVALYNYAHLPQRFKAQRLIHVEDLPAADERLAIFLMAAQRLLDGGYKYIGLDHFALPDDELNLAQHDNSLHRNFQGYTTCADSDLVALGVSAIGKIGTTHVQNERSLKAYRESIGTGQLATFRGLDMNADDIIRADVIMRLMCSATIAFVDLQQQHKINFQQYFTQELKELTPYIDAGLVELNNEQLAVTATGRLFVRAISMVFDSYLSQRTTASYSQLI